jgi:hypothetical protein
MLRDPAFAPGLFLPIFWLGIPMFPRKCGGAHWRTGAVVNKLGLRRVCQAGARGYAKGCVIAGCVFWRAAYLERTAQEERTWKSHFRRGRT